MTRHLGLLALALTPAVLLLAALLRLHWHRRDHANPIRSLRELCGGGIPTEDLFSPDTYTPRGQRLLRSLWTLVLLQAVVLIAIALHLARLSL